jgi:hypothetical protein
LNKLTQLRDYLDEGDLEGSNAYIKKTLKEMVSTYQPQEFEEKCVLK